MTLEELEKITGMKYEEQRFVMRMSMAITCINDEDKKEDKNVNS